MRRRRRWRLLRGYGWPERSEGVGGRGVAEVGDDVISEPFHVLRRGGRVGAYHEVVAVGRVAWRGQAAEVACQFGGATLAVDEAKAAVATRTRAVSHAEVGVITRRAMVGGVLPAYRNEVCVGMRAVVR